jgi:hypothetical protein
MTDCRFSQGFGWARRMGFSLAVLVVGFCLTASPSWSHTDESTALGSATGFEACADGLTVADNETGLLWERKTGTFDPSFPASAVCETAGCPDLHDVNNRYEWSNVAPDPNGNAYTDFLARLNGLLDPDAVTGCFAGHCDWRLPELSELQTILIGSGAAPGQEANCTSASCIDPDFAMVGGPTASSVYWSASSVPTNPFFGWTAGFINGGAYTGSSLKTSDYSVRAVRAGSCGS